MKLLFSCVLVLLISSYSAARSSLEVPNYEVLEKLASNIEIRKYEETKWVATSAEGDAKDSRTYSSTMFNKLFNYISGQNSDNKKIEMTAPVTTIYNNKENSLITPESRVHMSMRFYVPREFHDNTPQPTGDAYLETDSEMVVASIQFGGYATMDDNLRYRDLLIEALGAEASKYDTVNIITAGYDSPYKPIRRRNEVWLRRID